MLTTTEKSYLETALWSSDLDGHSPEDIDPSTRKAMLMQMHDFLNTTPEVDLVANTTPEIVHDFWLTRNNHGAGFWDGDYPEPYATVLSKRARHYGPIDLYVHEGVIYV